MAENDEIPAPPAGGAGRREILVAGASGYIGRALVSELLARGHGVTTLQRRPGRNGDSGPAPDGLPCPTRRVCDLLDPTSLARDGLRGDSFDAVFSCIASRGGGIADAWRVEHEANRNLLDAVRQGGARQFVLLSAICVQKPRLAFQQAKLAFEAELRASDLPWTIVRPTAYFKSLAGQVERVREGRPFLVFGNGELTACKPIGERDLARFLADCIDEPARQGAVLPIGGPGPAITPRAQGELLFELTGRSPRFRRLPVRFFDAIVGSLGLAAKLVPGLADKAEFARIGRYYGTESMLVWDSERGAYDADATPEFGTETLRDFYRRVLADGLAGQELGEQAVFDRQRP